MQPREEVDGGGSRDDDLATVDGSAAARSLLTGLRRRDSVVLMIVLVAMAVGVALEATDRAGAPEVGAGAGQSPEELAAELGCEGVEELSYFNVPIRGAAATRGIACSVGPDEVHIFERAPRGDLDPEKSYAARQGGSLENIDRLIGTDLPQPCLSLLVGPNWFVVANNEGILRQVEGSAGGVERPIVRGAPPASYPGPGGCGSG